MPRRDRLPTPLFVSTSGAFVPCRGVSVRLCRNICIRTRLNKKHNSFQNNKHKFFVWKAPHSHTHKHTNHHSFTWTYDIPQTSACSGLHCHTCRIAACARQPGWRRQGPRRSAAVAPRALWPEVRSTSLQERGDVRMTTRGQAQVHTRVDAHIRAFIS
jgi:hypothetical protein